MPEGQNMPEETLRILAFGAHPDDCDIKSGGIALLYAQQGHRVRFVSTTNGATGHHEIGGIELARRRYEEAQAVARLAGIEYHVLDNHTGELEPTVANRKQIIRIIREFRPDLILVTARTTTTPTTATPAQLVQDAAYMVTVPNMVPLTPHLEQIPVIAYFSDGFQKPIPVRARCGGRRSTRWSISKIDMLHCHVSQMYEWLPYNGGYLDQVPARRERPPRLARSVSRVPTSPRRPTATGTSRRALWPRAPAASRHAEAFEGCEYGARLTPERRLKLFPFLR